MRALLLFIVGLLLVAGCSQHEVDEAAWRTEVESQQGHQVADWEGYKGLWTDLCNDDKSVDDWATMVAVWTDKGDTVAEMEMNLRHACPDALENFRAGAQQIQDTSAKFDEICATDPSLRTEDEQFMAEAVGC